MHVHSKRMKFNILLTTYEILLKDKVSSYFNESWMMVLPLCVTLFMMAAFSPKAVQYDVIVC